MGRGGARGRGEQDGEPPVSAAERLADPRALKAAAWAPVPGSKVTSRFHGHCTRSDWILPESSSGGARLGGLKEKGVVGPHEFAKGAASLLGPDLPCLMFLCRENATQLAAPSSPQSCFQPHKGASPSAVLYKEGCPWGHATLS